MDTPELEFVGIFGWSFTDDFYILYESGFVFLDRGDIARFKVTLEFDLNGEFDDEIWWIEYEDGSEENIQQFPQWKYYLVSEEGNDVSN